jgi:hypothetical protein
MHVPLETMFVASRPSMTCSAVGVEDDPVRATQQIFPAMLARMLAVTELIVDPPLVGAKVQIGVTLVGMALLVTEFSAFISPSATSMLLRAVRVVPVTLA